MCGIVGRFAWEGPVDPEGLLPGLPGLLAHRGPDGAATWSDGPFFLGHRRLAIIDLATGAQPMGTADGALVVTFNGEIYNYRELREELGRRGHDFRTSSDTEVLLAGYREWGEGLLPRLVGQFAFAIADRIARTLFLARDPFGEKPLFYSDAPHAVTFGSELRVLAALPGLRRRIDEDALGAYLRLNYVPGESTLLESVRRLAPGTWRRYSADGSVRSGAYWAPPRPALRSRPVERELSDLRSELDWAVRLALVSDVPVGIFLSGGMDSSLVAESAARQGSLTRAFCLDFPEPGHSEWPRARTVADRLGIALERVALEPGAAADFLAVVEHADDPLADSSALAVWTVSRAAARTHKVVLGGDGGDELFAGYLTYRASQLHAALVSRGPRPLRRALARAAGWLPVSEGKVTASYKAMRFLRASTLPTSEAHFTWNGTWLAEEAARLLRTGSARAAARTALSRLAAARGLSGHPDLADLQRADISEYLPNDILAKVDRMSMAHGLEVRAPFLQPAMAEFALGLPADWRCPPNGPTKRLLRELARRVYGNAIADAPKQGFSIPIHAWLRGPLREVAEDLLSPGAVEALGVLDPGEVARVWRAHVTGRRSWGWEVWGLMVLSAWHRGRVVSPPRPVAGEVPPRREIPLARSSPLRPASAG
jgi:asparagine synthase (glutamine-hydrolysing)